MAKESKDAEFIKRVSKLSEDKLIIIIPKDRLDDFSHKDLVKVTLIKKGKGRKK